MATATRITKSLSLDRKMFKAIERTKGSGSTSERVNELLRAGLELERKQHLDVEAAAFFSQAFNHEEGELADAFHTAAVAALIEDGE